jgi:hypothetical protein
MYKTGIFFYHLQKLFFFTFLMSGFIFQAGCSNVAEEEVTVSVCPGKTVLEGSCGCAVPETSPAVPAGFAPTGTPGDTSGVAPVYFSVPYSDWQLKNYPMLYVQPNRPPKKKYLYVSSAQFGGQRRALRSFRFVGRVGGIEFATIARPESGLKNKKIELRYDTEQDDGCRLLIHIDGKTYRVFLPDWVMVPAALYADSQHTALVSLFGEDTDAESFDIVYHEAVADTLMGLRLLQADILLFEKSTASVFESRGEEILGLGERSFKDRINTRTTINMLRGKLSEHDVDSWVMTDLDVDVIFSVRDGAFQLSGFPYYYFWRGESRALEEYASSLSEEVLEEFMKFRMNPMLDPEIQPSPRIKAVLEKMETLMHDKEVISLDALTEDFRNARRDHVRSLNPLVMDAVTQLMRYAAFFRHVRDTHPDAWREFLPYLKTPAGITVVPEPQVVTPTKLDRS